MNRWITGVMAGAVVGTLAVSIAYGQASIYVSGGPSIPVGEYGDYAKTGWLATAGLSVPVGGKGLSVGGELMYGSNKHSDVAGDKTNLPGAFGFLMYRAGDQSKPGVYFFGQAGILNHQFKTSGSPGYSGESDWKPAAGGGVGVDIPVGGASVFVEGRFITRSGTSFIPIQAGVSIPVGSKR